jgi:hypothetical protein
MGPRGVICYTMRCAPGSGRLGDAAEKVAAGRGGAAGGDSEGGNSGHDQGGDLRPLLRQAGVNVTQSFILTTPAYSFW